MSDRPEPSPVPTSRDARAPLLPESAVVHRQGFWDYILAEAAPWHRRHLTRLFEVWEKANAEYFDDALVPPYVLLAEPSAPNIYGDCGRISSFGGISQIRLRPSLLRGTHPHTLDGSHDPEGLFRFMADILLHETVHQWQQEVSGELDEGHHGHGTAFRDQANRIGARLGLPPVRTSKKRGKDRDLPSCAQWPHNVRPADWYLGAFVPWHEPRPCPCPYCPGHDLASPIPR